MSPSLDRILRLREQSEEICRLHLKREMLKLREVESAVDASREESRVSRREAFRALTSNTRDGWLLAEGSWELAEWKSRLLQPELQQQRERVEELRHRFLQCRIEKRQVEQLVEAAARAATAAETRRQQSALDAWYEQVQRRQSFPRR